ncbi:DUF397 domain-containing protein [Actinomadura sp. LD22]|uniref:DUF397 domain-containing protein n=1 Tax=Actinomadura physcomitrii TaxID=2650748 RepID=A0A6I4MJV3_9ACTN|nr:DUF397 domain-containing protein [Actinomadura physcomitrii]MWA06152.1 DUF397 domain-containing protein [Actinomadura physcomitrii]
MFDVDPTRADFRKSSYSEGGNGCVEAAGLGMFRLLRDSKNPNGGFLSLRRGEWVALVTEIKQGKYDLDEAL